MTYEVHLNGLHHCSVRYRQLHNLHQQLKRELASISGGNCGGLPVFPPKKLMVLSSIQLEERKMALEKYLQLVSQDPRLSGGLAFNGFLLAAQQESWADSEASTGSGGGGQMVDLDVYLMNDQKYTVRGRCSLQTDDVLEILGKELGIPEELIFCYGLFLIRRQEASVQIVRKFQEHESPYISMKAQHGSDLKLVLRKWSWDPKTDDLLCDNKASLNVLYIQTLSDVESGMLQANASVRRQLAGIQSRGAKKEYMELARSLKDFGYVHFMPCVCDYPNTNTKVSVLIGGRELIVRVTDKNGDVKEAQFRITRMRCWRIMSAEPTALEALNDVITKNGNGGTAPSCEGCPPALELSFEYLMPSASVTSSAAAAPMTSSAMNKEMQWVSITSPQAILMSICLQSMVEELLRIRNNPDPENRPHDGLRRPSDGCSVVRQYTHRKQDGTDVVLSVRCPSPAANARAKMQQATNNLAKVKAAISRRQYSVKSLSERFDVVQMKETSRAAENVLISENEAFQEVKEIGGGPSTSSSSQQLDNSL